jgi:hypothetical protein
MRLALWIACLWPGLPQAWRLGSLRGLGLAIAFAAVLNTALVCSLVWPRWPIASLPAGSTAAIGWVWVLGLWIVGLNWSRRSWPELCPPKVGADPQIDNWFREAQHEYLKGHWIEAESLLTRLLARQPADVEARLLLASIQRRSSHREQARRTLTELQPIAGRWQWEIEADLERLAEVEQEESGTALIPTESVRKAA